MESLVLFEVSQKQNYIFSSNKLKENIGASIIVEKVVEELPLKIGKGYKDKNIYNGGGSSLYKFDSKEEAEEFVRKVSEKILEEYPGVEVFMVILEFNPKMDRLIDVMDKAYEKLGIKKSRRKHSGEQISFGIERLCDSTGLSATGKDDEGNYISDEILVKLNHSKERNDKFQKLLLDNKMETAFRNLAGGDKNYMAVIHIDGNRMGEKFASLKERFEDKYKDGDIEKVNKEYEEALQMFSNNIKKAYEDAFIAMSKAIEENIDKIRKDGGVGKNTFPLIPLIVAGDDITYVTNGKIGIETARIFLEHLYNNDIEIYNGEEIKLNACAGVAIIRTSYPFMKAYELAEDLCDNSKLKLRENYQEEDFSLIDWHIEQGDLEGAINEIREKYYKTTIGNIDLNMRPLYLNNRHNEEWKTYDNFLEAYNNIMNRKIEKDKIARNKIKGLREILLKGEKETETYLKSNKIENYFARFENTQGDYCFAKDGCMYFDAIEIMDYYIKLNVEEEANV